jgi:HAD superfamily hydrolase (TIGR01509 family)
MGIRVILFDVGGVLVELGGVDALLRWMGQEAGQEVGQDPTVEQLWSVWLRSPSVRAFETGRIDPAQFATGILAELKLTVAPEVFLESFATWPTRPYPGAMELIGSIPKHYQCALLSNSNRLHWPRVMDGMGLRSRFEHCFSSHLTGKIKPDAESFEHVLQTLRCEAAEVLFLDDNLLNVEAARRVGLSAERVLGVEGARLALQQVGIVG